MATQAQSTSAARNNTLKSLLLPALRNFVIGVIVLGVVLCLLAGSFSYWRGWILTVLFALLTTAQGIYLGLKDPELLKRRTQVGTEGESRAQRIFIVVGLLGILGLFVVSALDRRFGWSQVPVLVSVLGDALVVFSFYLYYLVFRENSYAATSIKTFEGQKVISTGPYAFVRHPKYVGDLFLVIGVPLALGSWWALALIVLTVAGLVWRILDEEKLLNHDLPGYVEYTQQVRYRLVPYLW
jgi:protein-S-isoprenylcysteine O-methyltransferase Ste14